MLLTCSEQDFTHFSPLPGRDYNPPPNAHCTLKYEARGVSWQPKYYKSESLSLKEQLTTHNSCEGSQEVIVLISRQKSMRIFMHWIYVLLWVCL